MSQKDKSVPLASWPSCIPPTNDAYFTVYCDTDHLYWGFHRSNGHYLRWRTAHISKPSDDPIQELALHFPDDSDAMYYVFGSKTISSQSAVKKSKERSSVKLYIFYIDAAPMEVSSTVDDKENHNNDINAICDRQINFLSSLWSAVPCNQFRIRAKHFVESSALLSSYEEKIKRNFGTKVIASFACASAHYDHPILTLCESNDGIISYIGSWVVPDSDEKVPAKAIANGKPFLMVGSLSAAEKDKELDELNKVVYRWKQNVIDCQPDIKCLAIVIADDPLHLLEGKLIKMLDEKEDSGLKDSGFQTDNISFPLLYGMNYLMDGFREKAAKEAILAKKRAEEKARAEAKRLLNRKRLERLEEEAKKHNDMQGIEREGVSRKRRSTDKPLINSNDIEGIERTGTAANGKKSKKDKGKSYIGLSVAKEFEDGVIYFGTVKEFINDDEPFWNIRYEDGDGEDMDEKELTQSIAFYDKVNKQNKKKGSSKFKVFTPSKKP